LQPDTLVPGAGNPQAFNRYSYTNNNPSRFSDPSGHLGKDNVVCTDDGYCGTDKPTTDKKTFLWSQANSILNELGGINDLEAMARIIEAGASVYSDFDALLPALSGVFIGVERSGPGTLWAAAVAAQQDGCAGVGRDIEDCPTNTVYFRDTGFHPDFRDTHNQIFHLWGYIANTAVPGNTFKGNMGVFEAVAANGFHEIDQSIIATVGEKLGMGGDAFGPGTSWQDYVLSEAGMKIGTLITNQAITPMELADLIRNMIGSQGSGSGGRLQQLQDYYGPLYGSP